ncbi:hypothetical protein DFH07DRAFT_950491 [Mycena maculata]|uniref:Peptidase S53 activation domain-containing protein n=1 Tax=Mycena maculata TaxID=230809 RepID=A0AAD7K6K7_9AGAR|nr:hypothetical protein DFH07DRAFT_950491 [Mycena maculata]
MSFRRVPSFSNRYLAFVTSLLAEVVDMFALSHETIAAMKNQLIDAGVSTKRLQLLPSRGWIAVNVTVEEAENLLHADFHNTHPLGTE